MELAHGSSQMPQLLCLELNFSAFISGQNHLILCSDLDSLLFSYFLFLVLRVLFSVVGEKISNQGDVGSIPFFPDKIYLIKIILDLFRFCSIVWKAKQEKKSNNPWSELRSFKSNE